MKKPRAIVVVALASTLSAGALAQVSAQQRVGKPRPAPNTQSTMPPLPPAEFDPDLAIGGEDLKARKLETRLTVPVRVNGRGPYNFIVDSGADTSVVGLRIAHGLQLPLAQPVVLNGMTARNIVDRVKVDRFTLGSTTLKNLQLPALRESDLGGEGMIGIDALVRQRLMMDFEKRTIKIEDARIPVRTYPGEIVVTALRRRGQLILTQVLAAGLPVEAVIDTGTQVTIGNLALRDKLIRGNRDRFAAIEVTGVTGVKMQMHIARIGKLQLGPVTLHNVPMAFADVPPFEVFGLSGQPALLLGTDLLESFRRVSLDFQSRKVRFQVRRCGTQGVSVHTSPESTTRISSAGTPDVCGR